MRKILVAVPCMDMISARFAQCLTTLKKEGEVSVMFHIGSLIYDARNNICRKALEMGVDFIMWFDSDMVFPDDTMVRMVKTLDEHPEIEVLTGLYFRRGQPFSPVLFSRLEINEFNQCEHEDVYDYPAELFEVAGCGFGCVLMRTDCLKDILLDEEGALWFSPMGNVGEDCAFCIRARNSGYKIFCDPSIKLGHLAYTPVTEQVYRQMRKSEILKNG